MNEAEKEKKSARVNFIWVSDEVSETKNWARGERLPPSIARVCNGVSSPPPLKTCVYVGCMCVCVGVFPLQLVYHHSVNGGRVAVIWFWCLNAETQKQSSADGKALKTNRPKNNKRVLVSELVVTRYRCDTGSPRNMSADRMSICSDFTRATYCCPILSFSSTTHKRFYFSQPMFIWFYYGFSVSDKKKSN